MAILQVLVTLTSPSSISKYRQISPLLLTLLLTNADASFLGSGWFFGLGCCRIVINPNPASWRTLDRTRTRDLRSHKSSEAVLVRPYVPVESAHLQATREIEASDCTLRTGAYQPGCSTYVVVNMRSRRGFRRRSEHNQGWRWACPRGHEKHIVDRHSRCDGFHYLRWIPAHGPSCRRRMDERWTNPTPLTHECKGT
jgi:hypothetical protein